MQKGWSECPAPSVPAGEIERFVVEQIQTIGTDEDLLNQTIGQIESRSEQLHGNLEAERKSLQRQLRNDHEKLRAIAANATNNGRVAGLPELQKRIDTAEDRLKAIGIELQSLEAQAIDTAEVRRLLAGFEEHFSPRLWHGFRLLAVDGSTARLPNTDDVIATFGEPPEGSSVPLARLSRLYDVLNDLVIVADIESRHVGERVLAGEYLAAARANGPALVRSGLPGLLAVLLAPPGLLRAVSHIGRPLVPQ